MGPARRPSSGASQERTAPIAAISERKEKSFLCWTSIWGWILRIFVAVAFLVLPSVVSSTSAVVNYGPRLQQIQHTYAAQIATAKAVDPATLKVLGKDPSDRAALAAAVKQLVAAQDVTPVVAVHELVALKQ